MIEVRDNFLTNEEFTYLNSIGLLLDAKTKNKNYYAEGCAYTIVNRADFGDVTRIQFLMGKKILSIIEKSKSFVNEFVENIPPIETTWFCYANKGYVIPKHSDVVVNFSKNIHLNYKVFIFCHNHWDSEWGGQLGFDSNNTICEPLPNRAVLYTPNEVHYVNRILENANITRMYLGMRWGKEGYIV